MKINSCKRLRYGKQFKPLKVGDWLVLRLGIREKRCDRVYSTKNNIKAGFVCSSFKTDNKKWCFIDYIHF